MADPVLHTGISHKATYSAARPGLHPWPRCRKHEAAPSVLHAQALKTFTWTHLGDPHTLWPANTQLPICAISTSMAHGLQHLRLSSHLLGALTSLSGAGVCCYQLGTAGNRAAVPGTWDALYWEQLCLGSRSMAPFPLNHRGRVSEGG